MRRDEQDLYINRLSAAFDYLNKIEKPLFKVTPFFEIRRNIGRDSWERKELGVEISKDIFPWLYLGEAIQQGWMKEDYRYDYDVEKRRYAESETRVLFSHNLLESRYLEIKGFVLNEYNYDFNRGAGVRNEVAMGIKVSAGKHAEVDIHWRHIDRIHYFDSDNIEAGLTLIF